MFRKIIEKPWGFYLEISQEQNYLVKKIIINPFSSTSLQVHSHRTECFFILKGTLNLIKNDSVLTLKPNDFAFIKEGEVHKLENKNSNMLELLEVQIGSMISEQDITRLYEKSRDVN